MRGTSTPALIVVAAVVAMVALAGLAVLQMGGTAVGGTSASVSLSGGDGVVTATIQVLKGALKGVAIRYVMPNGSAWWAKPIHCMAVDNTAEVTPTAAYFSKPVSAGQVVTCTFYIWAPSDGIYRLWVLGYGSGGTASPTTLAQSRLHLSVNKYRGNLPADGQGTIGGGGSGDNTGGGGSGDNTGGGGSGDNTGDQGTTTSGTKALISLPAASYVHDYILVPVDWTGGVLEVQAQWGYTKTRCSTPGGGLHITFFVPLDYMWRRIAYPGYTPVGSIPEMRFFFDTYYDGDIYVELANASHTFWWLNRPNDFNTDKYWPTNTAWTTYLTYNATSNTVWIRWVVPGAFDIEHTYNLAELIPDYDFPPPTGRYYVVIGLYSSCSVDWQLYSYTVTIRDQDTSVTIRDRVTSDPGHLTKNTISLPYVSNVYDVIFVPVDWTGGVLEVQAQWGYTKSECITPDEGLYITFFVPLDYMWQWATPVGSIPEMHFYFYTYSDGYIYVELVNASHTFWWLREPSDFNTDKYWPTNTMWTTYLTYNATSNTVWIRWVVPGAFDIEHTYNLTELIPGYDFPPPTGRYYVAIGLHSLCDTDWQLYSYTIITS